MNRTRDIMKADGKSVIFTEVIHSGHCTSPSPGMIGTSHCATDTVSIQHTVSLYHNVRRLPLNISQFSRIKSLHGNCMLSRLFMTYANASTFYLSHRYVNIYCYLQPTLCISMVVTKLLFLVKPIITLKYYNTFCL